MVFFVPVDIPLAPLLPARLSDAAEVTVDMDVLLEVIVEEMMLPSVVMTTTCVVT